MTTTTIELPTVFVLLKDPVWNGLKPDKIHLFSKSYLTDGSADLLNHAMDDGLEYMRKGMIYDEEVKNFYWTFDPKGSFIDNWVTPDLLADTRAFTEFRTWFESVITLWAAINKLPIKFKRDKPLEYVIKAIIDVLPAPAISVT